jgi:hypothetical protein
VSARDKFLTVIKLSPLFADAVVDEILNEHAHELAEKIRVEAPDMGAEEYGSHQNVLEAADLIDPEVTP